MFSNQGNCILSVAHNSLMQVCHNTILRKQSTKCIRPRKNEGKVAFSFPTWQGKVMELMQTSLPQSPPKRSPGQSIFVCIHVIFCTGWTYILQINHENQLKIKDKYKTYNLSSWISPWDEICGQCLNFSSNSRYLDWWTRINETNLCFPIPWRLHITFLLGLTQGFLWRCLKILKILT